MLKRENIDLSGEIQYFQRSPKGRRETKRKYSVSKRMEFPNNWQRKPWLKTFIIFSMEEKKHDLHPDDDHEVEAFRGASFHPWI